MFKLVSLLALLATVCSTPVEYRPYAKSNSYDTYSVVYRLKDLANGQQIFLNVGCFLYVSVSDEAAAQAYEQNVLVKSQDGQTISLTDAAKRYDNNNIKMSAFAPGVLFTIVNNNIGPATYENTAVLYFVTSVGKDVNYVVDARSALELHTLVDSSVGRDYYTVLSARTNILVSSITGQHAATFVYVYAGGLNEAQDSSKMIQSVTGSANPASYIFLEAAVTMNKVNAIGTSGWQFYSRYSVPDQDGVNNVIMGSGMDSIFTSPNALVSTKSANALYKFTTRDSTAFKVNVYGDLHGSSVLTLTATGPSGQDSKTINNRYAMNGQQFTVTGTYLTINYTRGADDYSYGTFAQIYT